jgi:uncharacterized protein
LALDLVAMGEEKTVDGAATFGMSAGGVFFSIAPASELGVA